tara:strand:- start:480 stop:806 length:327 start_codon:yes stop_codon:yes gene_type:complete
MGKRHKYGAKPTTVDGMRFDSKAEARRYGELKLLERAEVITELVVHPQYWLHADGVRKAIGYYEADFAYEKDGGIVIEDVKGVRTAIYKWKKRHFEAEYGLEVTEIKV